MNTIQYKGIPWLGISILALVLAGCDTVASIITPQKEATFTLNYDGNTATSGSAPVDTRAYLAGETAAVAGNTGGLAKTGFTFSGWNTQPDGLGTNFAGQNALTIGRANVTLYARWTPANVLSVTYFSNGATSGAPPLDRTGYQTNASAIVLPNSGQLVKTGSSFIGWNTTANSSGASYLPGSVLKLANAGVDLYAQWTTASTFTVTYNANGASAGTVPSDTTAYLTGAEVTVKANSGNLNRPGFTFGGWSNGAAGTAYLPGTTFNIASASVVLSAVWNPVATYSVTYNVNGGTGSVPVDSTAYLAGQTATVLDSTDTLAKTGATFGGWNTATDASGTPYTKGQTLVVDSHKTLYAVWTTDPSFKVIYDGNGNTGGTAPTDRTNYTSGALATVQGNSGSLLKTGSTFTGWNTNTAGSGTTYTPGATVVIGTSDVTLYAIWSNQPTYKITYNSNGGTSGAVPVDATSYVAQASARVLDNLGNLAKTGSTFAGWNTTSDGKGTNYAPNASLTVASADVTLYAVWAPIPTYTVTYNANGASGGTAPSDDTAYFSGATITVLGNPNTLTKTGHTFSGWSVSTDGTLTTYGQGATFALGAANLVLYAVWTPLPTYYTVTYVGNGSTAGSVPFDATSYTSGQTVAVLGNTGGLAKSGSSFAGWNTASNESGTTYTAGTTLTLGAANLTLYAVWTTNPTFSVTYNANGATGGAVPSDSTNYQSGTTVTVLGNTGNLVKTGSSFTGWNTASNGSGTPYAAGNTFAMGSAGVVLYAIWGAAPTYSVTYDANGASGGSVPTDAAAYLAGATVTAKNNTGNLFKTGATFAGWNTAADGLGTSYAVGTTFPMAGANLTLYARWTYTSITVTGALTTVNVVYNATDAADTALAQNLLKLLSSDLRLAPGVSGTLNVFNVNLIAQSTVPITFSSTYVLSGGLIILTPGTTIGVYPGANVGAGQNLVNQGVPVVAMGNAVKLLDDVTSNAGSWLTLLDPTPTALGWGPSATGGGATKIVALTTKSSAWSSPLSLASPPADGSSVALFTTGQSWAGVYNPTTANPIAGVALGREPSATSYVPVERQGRFLHWGYYGLPDTTEGRLFFLNLVNSQLTPLGYTYDDLASSQTLIKSFEGNFSSKSFSGAVKETYADGLPFTKSADGTKLHPGAIVLYKTRGGNNGVFTVTERGLYTGAGAYKTPNYNAGLFLQYTTFTPAGGILQQAKEGIPVMAGLYGDLQGIPKFPDLRAGAVQTDGFLCTSDPKTADFSWTLGTSPTVNGPFAITLVPGNNALFYVFK